MSDQEGTVQCLDDVIALLRAYRAALRYYTSATCVKDWGYEELGDNGHLARAALSLPLSSVVTAALGDESAPHSALCAVRESQADRDVVHLQACGWQPDATMSGDWFDPRDAERCAVSLDVAIVRQAARDHGQPPIDLRDALAQASRLRASDDRL